ncbi:hypothetical protein NW739_05135 [Mycoplasmopsis felis]|uniref:hypothetical protein n=1 Tax=Mycoplasmopsis felis TaxID=33923 RepID=UPI0021AE8A58|nr:hypothetical protein [Mycoplasmopsis felis]MCU9940065.1 hypothetical protein [Mycoplasmopsis felis]UWV79579.1 hypothetical protein NW072_06340 [Mycoplasmopsis felis]
MLNAVYSKLVWGLFGLLISLWDISISFGLFLFSKLFLIPFVDELFNNEFQPNEISPPKNVPCSFQPDSL